MFENKHAAGEDSRGHGPRIPVSARVRTARRLVLWTVALVGASLPATALTVAERLDETRLATIHRDAAALQQLAHPLDSTGELKDIRCVLHIHSNLSHDSRGTAAQIAAAAKAAGVQAVFMTEHPTADRRWVTEGLSGLKEGVLFVPGAELSDGLSVWRGEKTEWTPDMKAGEVLEKLRGTDAVAVVCHPEKRKEDADWNLPPYAGMEIYNSHADAEDNGFGTLLQTAKGGSPLKLLGLLTTMKKYPQEAYAAIFDEQVAILKRWDTLNAGFLTTGRHVVGTAGNDSHQNVGVSVEAGEEMFIVKDALGKQVSQFPRKGPAALLFGNLAPGTVILSQTFDPYEVSFRYVSTHVLAPEVSEGRLLDAVQKGRAYVAFDWIADPTGFRYTATAGGKSTEMGGEVSLAGKPSLTAHTDLPCEIRILRNGLEVSRGEGVDLVYQPQETGVYRVEAWVTLAGEKRPWIYSNPIYVLP